MKATETLYLNADKTEIVRDEADPAAAFLLCIPGDELSAADVERYGLTGEATPADDPPVIATENLYVNADRTALVPEGDPAAAFLLATAGDEVDKADAERYGLVAESAPAEPAKGDGEKQAPELPNKEAEPGEDKGSRSGLTINRASTAKRQPAKRQAGKRQRARKPTGA